MHVNDNNYFGVMVYFLLIVVDTELFWRDG